MRNLITMHNYTKVPTKEQDGEDTHLRERRSEPTRPNIPSTNTQIIRGDQIEQPGPLSTVVQIRKYIVQVLHGCYDVPLEEAQGAAALWQDKLGEEFVATSRDEMGELLGERYADLLWAYKDALKRESRASLCRISLVMAGIVILGAVIMTGCFLADRYQKGTYLI